MVPGRAGKYDWKAVSQPAFEELYEIETENDQMNFTNKLMLHLEEFDNCAGLDKKKLFYYQRPFEIDQGIPYFNCTDE